MRLEAEQQRKEGDVFFADGNVEIHYRNFRLRADHVQYNAKTYVVMARGNVQLDVDTQHLTADSADFNVRSGEGRFEHVRGEVRAEHRPNAIRSGLAQSLGVRGAARYGGSTTALT